MIWFACKQCGKRHGRPEAQAGTLVFCDCGQGNRVPWTSVTVLDAVPAEAIPARPVAVPPPLEALPAAVPVPSEPQPEPPLPARRPGRLPGKVNPHFCFHHDDIAAEATCAACRLPFCGACVVFLQEVPLCGPCKNFRLASHGTPRRVLPLAIIALVVALTSGPVVLSLSLAAAGLFLGEGILGVAVLLCVLAAVLPGTGIVLAGQALRRIDHRPHSTGRGLAAAATGIALVGVVWSFTVAVLLVGKRVLE